MKSLWTKKLPLLAVIPAVLLAAGCSKINSKPAVDISPTAFIRPNAPESVPTTLPAAPTQATESPLPSPAPRPQNQQTGDADPITFNVPSSSSPSSSSPDPADIEAAPEPQSGQTLPVAALLGTVNGTPIFVSDVLNPISSQLKSAAAQSRTEDYFREQIIQAIGQQVQSKVDDILMLHSAQVTLTKDDMKEVDGFVAQQKAKIVAQYQGSEEQANLDLEAQGSSLDQKLQDLHDQAMVEFYREKMILPKIVVTRKQIWDYYHSHMYDYTQQASADLYTITYPVIRMWPLDPTDPTHTNHITDPTPQQIQEARNKAIAYCQSLEDQIKQGASFAFLAEDNSVDYQAQNGGHTPGVSPGEFSDVIDKVIFSLQSNSMAPPLLISDPQDPRRDVVMIMKVGHVQPFSIVSFGIAQTTITDMLKNQQYQVLMNQYIQQLQNGASSSAEMQMVNTAADVAVALYYK